MGGRCVGRGSSSMPGASSAEAKLAAAAEMQLGGGAPKSRSSETKKKKKKPKKFWLSAWNDPMAGLSCYSACIRFADLEGDGNYSLLCATLDKKLKIFRDMSTFFDSVLLGTPVAMVPLYTDAENLDKPSIAIAAGPYVFIYRHLRPYFKFTVPPVDVNVTELAIWTSLGAGKTDVGSAVTSLTELRDKGVEVTTRTLELLSYDDEAEQTMFADRVKSEALTQTTVITCMEKISTNSSEEISVSRLVIGTESRQLMIVDSTDCSIVMNSMMPDVPVFIAALGLMDTDYRILVCAMPFERDVISGCCSHLVSNCHTLFCCCCFFAPGGNPLRSDFYCEEWRAFFAVHAHRCPSDWHCMYQLTRHLHWSSRQSYSFIPYQRQEELEHERRTRYP